MKHGTILGELHLRKYRKLVTFQKRTNIPYHLRMKIYPRLEEQSNDMKNISLAIHRRRRKNMFALTKCHKEVHRTLESIEVKTNSDEPFILYNESAKG